ncbi:MAG: YicC/YloC family endoribonuclease [Opitutaceae bacterium]
MKSMTGFGRGAVSRDGWDVTAQASSVNRKSLEVALSLPREWQLLEPEIAGLVRERFSRGRIQIVIELRGAKAAGFQWDEAAVDAVIERLARTAARHGVEFRASPELIFSIASATPGQGTALAAEEALALIRGALLPALEKLAVARAREGAVLAADIQGRALLLRDLVGEIARQSASTVQNYRENLLQRLRNAGLEVDLSDERVLKEIALFAERIDITEEITRLGSHLEHLVALAHEQEPVGRKTEFLLQEIGREVHTIGSKANDIEIARRVIAFKNELERVREQIQNVE